MTTTTYKAPINPDILRWARESVFIGIDKAAQAVAVKTEIYKKWEHGEDFPTISRLRKLSNLFKRPLPVFFMSRVPETPPIPHDFRKPVTAIEQPLTKDSIMALRKARWYQTTAGNLMKDLGKTIKSLPQEIRKNKPIESIIKEIRTISLETQFAWESNWQALKSWRQYLEGQGIYVFQMSMPIEEVRGFSLVREECPPVIVINSKDSPNGRIFTLFHEYSHILLNESGICMPEEIDFTIDDHNEAEQFCNEFAGNFLVPTAPLRQLVTTYQSTDILELLKELSGKFSVSRFVILRRLYALKEIDYNMYKDIYQELQTKIKRHAGGGGNFYKNKFAEKGSKFISLVVEAESGNTITTSKALEFLEIKLKHYSRIVDMLFQ